MSEQYDAFREGVEPGGMRNTSGVRLLICYAIHAVGRPLTKETLLGGLSGGGLANYFEIGNAVDGLCEKGLLALVETAEAEQYALTPDGVAVVNALEKDIPKSVRAKAVAEIEAFELAERRRRENTIAVRETADGFAVTLHVGSPEDRLMSLTVYVADREQVDMMRRRMMKNPESLCETVFHALLDT